MFGVLSSLVMSGNWAYLILFLGSYFETLIFSSFLVYGEIFFIAGSMLAGANILNIWLVALVVILGGIFGDSTSFFMGKYFHKTFFKRPPGKLRQKAEAFMQKHGPKAIFFARFLGPLSWVMPFIAGMHKLNYEVFLKYNIPGVTLGIGRLLVLGYFLGFGYMTFIKKYWFLSVFSLILLVLVFFRVEMYNFFQHKILRKVK